jgi:hypothetical protein
MKRLLIVLLATAGLALAQDPPEKTPPAITWASPGKIRNPAALSNAQLNATASVPGTFAYDPPAGTVLPVGNGQTLTATFTPADPAAYNQATATVQIDVVSTYWPYDPSEPAYICHVNPDMTPVINAATGQPRCFVVPVPVSESITRYMLTQTLGLDANGTVIYKYPTWWDFMLEALAQKVVNPTLDLYPPPAVKTAKEQEDAAKKAVEDAKAAVFQGTTP